MCLAVGLVKDEVERLCAGLAQQGGETKPKLELPR